MKKITSDIAKSLKQIGYPNLKEYDIDGYEVPIGKGVSYTYPSYLDVWLWINEQRGIIFYPHYFPIKEKWSCWYRDTNRVLSEDEFGFSAGPEDAIVTAVDYIIEKGYINVNL